MNWGSPTYGIINESITKLQLEMAIQCIYDQYYQSWYRDLNNSSKLETLKSLNKVFDLEKYLSCIKIDNHRIALTRFRCSAHKLLIEEGRFRNIDRNLRVCQVCNSNIIED